ncbi:MAG: hypothetical protein Q8L06_00950, partial [Pseudohongiella sp.]|nr:hypothetical protein [Pseudohongiella sp.]
MSSSVLTPNHIVHKVIVLATGTPGSEEVRDYLLELYETNGHWDQVKFVVDDYMNNLLAQTETGIPGLIKVLALNGFGVNISLADAETLVGEFRAAGVDSWSGLFAYLHETVDGDLASVWNNRAESAGGFSELLGTLGKADDYNGKQALSAAREWVSGIGVSEESQLAANEAATSLIFRFIDGKVKGTAIDGYVSGATIFIDVNNNGEHDIGEPITTTDSKGDFVFNEDVLPEGILIGKGGIDLATGQAFQGKMTAPGGAAVISPLTTLVQQMMSNQPGKSQAAVEDDIFRALDIPRVDLSSFDPIQAGLNTNSTRDAQVIAAKVQAVTSQLVNVITVSSSVTTKLAPGNTNGNQGAVSALATAIQQAASSGSSINLSNPETVASVVKATAQNAGVVNEESSTELQDSVQRWSDQAGKSLEGINTKTQQAVDALISDSNSSVTDALSDVFKLQTLTQTKVVESIDVANAGDLQEVVDRFNGTSLDKEVENVQAGNLNEETPTNEGNVTRPNTPPAAPQLSLAIDSGVSDNDQVTNTVTINVSNLAANASWEFSVDGGRNWNPGSGDSFSIVEPGSNTVLVRQSLPGTSPSSAAALSFTLDNSAPSAPALSLAVSPNGSTVNSGVVNVNGIESGARWEFSLDGNTWSAGEGSSVTITNNGLNTLQVRQTDLAGNISDITTLSFTLDSVGPSAPTVSLANNTGVATDSITSDGTVTIGGIESGANWQFSLDGNVWSEGSGNSVTLTGDGSKTLQVRQTDAAGNVSASGALNFTLDSSAPIAPTLAMAENTNNPSDTVTSNRTINVSGLESGASWQFSLGGDVWADGSGSNFAVTDDGTYIVQVRQTDVAGNLSDASSLNFTLDTVKPFSPVIALADDTNIVSDSVTRISTVNVSGLESNASWEYSLDGSNWADGIGSSFAVVGDGNKSIQVRQTDVAGNVSDPVSLNFVFDTVAPPAPSLALASDTNNASDSITSNGAINVTGFESDATWQYSLDGSNWSDGSGSSVSVEGDGSKVLQVRQMDLAGNVSASGSLSFTLDTAAPSAPSLSLRSDTNFGSDSITSNGTINVAGLESDATWQYSLNGSTWSNGSGSSVSVEGDG